MIMNYTVNALVKGTKVMGLFLLITCRRGLDSVPTVSISITTDATPV